MKVGKFKVFENLIRIYNGKRGLHLVVVYLVVGRYRRLSKDYEYLPQTSETMIYAAMMHLMLRRLARSHPCSTA